MTISGITRASRLVVLAVAIVVGMEGVSRASKIIRIRTTQEPVHAVASNRGQDDPLLAVQRRVWTSCWRLHLGLSESNRQNGFLFVNWGDSFVLRKLPFETQGAWRAPPDTVNTWEYQFAWKLAKDLGTVSLLCSRVELALRADEFAEQDLVTGKDLMSVRVRIATYRWMQRPLIAAVARGGELGADGWGNFCQRAR